MASIVLGLLAALFFYKNGADFVRAHFLQDIRKVPEVIAFIMLFLIVFLVVKLLEVIFRNVIDEIQLGNADGFLGVIFGFAEGIAVISLILFLLRIQPLFDPSSILSDSFFARFILPLITGTERIPGV
jgi:membrane protein required for colicin V production